MVTGMRVRCDNAYLRPGSVLDLWLDRAIGDLSGVKDPRSRKTKLRMVEKIATHVGSHPEMGSGLFADFTIRQLSDEVGKSPDRIGDLLSELAGGESGGPYIRRAKKGSRSVGASVYELILDQGQGGESSCRSGENGSHPGENDAQPSASAPMPYTEFELAQRGEFPEFVTACKPGQDGGIPGFASIKCGGGSNAGPVQVSAMGASSMSTRITKQRTTWTLAPSGEEGTSSKAFSMYWMAAGPTNGMASRLTMSPAP